MITLGDTLHEQTLKPQSEEDAWAILEKLRIERWRLEIVSQGLQWSGFPGALLHSGLGMMLARVSPEVFAVLYGTPVRDVGPRPWWLQPPLDQRLAFAPQDILQFELTFVNPAPHWIEACAEAVKELGKAGIGRQRGRFTLHRMEPVPWFADAGTASARAALSGFSSQGSSCTLASMLRQARPSQPVEHIGLQFVTPVRLKAERGYVTQPPRAEVLIGRLLGRASMLSGLPTHWLPLAAEAQQQAGALRLTQDELSWDDVTRYSARQKAEMPLGGLTGWLRYSADGPTDALFSWLAVGEWLQLGARTTFGLGVYRLVPARYV